MEILGLNSLFFSLGFDFFYFFFIFVFGFGMMINYDDFFKRKKKFGNEVR